MDLRTRARREIRVLRAKARLQRHSVAYGRRPSFEGWLPYIQNQGRMTFGDRLVVQCIEGRVVLRTSQGAYLQVGHHGYINAGVTITAIGDSITIGDDVKIAGNVAISSTTGHEHVAGSGIRTAPVTIGNNVWIGRGAFIMPGVSVGDNAIVAAGAVVNQDVTPDTIVAGIPAKLVRRLPRSNGPRS